MSIIYRFGIRVFHFLRSPFFLPSPPVHPAIILFLEACFFACLMFMCYHPYVKLKRKRERDRERAGEREKNPECGDSLLPSILYHQADVAVEKFVVTSRIFFSQLSLNVIFLLCVCQISRFFPTLSLSPCRCWCRIIDDTQRKSCITTLFLGGGCCYCCCCCWWWCYYCCYFLSRHTRPNRNNKLMELKALSTSTRKKRRCRRRSEWKKSECEQNAPEYGYDTQP